jgi:hypothetical protein
MKTKKTAIVALCLILPLVTLCTMVAALGVANINSSPNPNTKSVKDFSFWKVGDNAILSSALSNVQPLGIHIMNLNINDINKNATLKAAVLNDSSVIVFDSSLLSQKATDVTTSSFFKDALSKRATLMAFGGSTSSFFDVLNKTDAFQFPHDENNNPVNPAYFNPPIVGFKLKNAFAPDGTEYFYPSMFIRNSNNTINFAQDLQSWIGD